MNWLKQIADEPNSPASASVFYLATFFGLIGGLGQIIVVAFEKFVLGHYVHQDPDILWMAPLVSILSLLLAASFFWLVERRAPRIVPRWLPTLFFAFEFYVSLLVMATWLQWIPILILAIGLAAETTRLIGEHSAGFDAVLRRTLGWTGFAKPKKKLDISRDGLTGSAGESLLTRRQFLVSTGSALAGLTLGSRTPDALGDWITLSHLPPPPRDAPNVLLITLDTVRAPSMSLYGYTRMTTPNLERLAVTTQPVRFSCGCDVQCD